MAQPISELRSYEQGVVAPLRIVSGIERGELADILREAAQDVAKLLQGNISPLRRAQLEAAMKGMGSLSSSIWGKIGAEVKAGIHDSARLSVVQQLDNDYLLGMPFNAIVQYSDFMVFNAFHHAENIISRRTNGFTLSERIIANGKQGVVQVGRVVERGLARGASAKEIAAEAAKLYLPSVPGGQSFAAFRLARTEINNAHHDTTIRLTQDQPWVLGYRWNTSRSHPKPDVCDSLASGGTGGPNFRAGEYSVRDVPSKPHPQCLCFLSIIQEDKAVFLSKLIDGDYDRRLESMGVS